MKHGERIKPFFDSSSGLATWVSNSALMQDASDAAAYEIEKNSVARAAAIEREAKALRDNPNLIQLRAIERWSGTLPTFTGGGQPIPFINVTPGAN